MTTHSQARMLATQSIQAAFGRDPIGGEAEGEAGIGYLETSYGDGWVGNGVGSNNIGAIQCGSSWPGQRFSYFDTHPNSDGTSTKYKIDFRKYSTPLDGWIDLCRVAYVNRSRESVRAAAAARDWYGMSKALHNTGYYEGYGKTVEDRIRNHYRALSRAIARANSEKLPVVDISEIPRTVRRGDGCQGKPDEAVKLMQMELQISADGIFGPATLERLRDYQSAHDLTVDGVCGRKTWETLFNDEYKVVNQ